MTEVFRKQLANALKTSKFRNNVYFAGGCVRDELLGRQINDIDIAVELPDGGIRLAEFLYKRKKTAEPVIYEQFGTALITMKKYKIELVMTRKESYRSHSRKPEVVFGSLKEDVMRRDFTVNSLLRRVSDGELIDLSKKGLKDLEKGIIRATSKPEIIFTEDPLRLLRAVRFAVELGFDIESDTYKQIKRQAGELQHISSERITDEFLRIMQHVNYLRGIYLLSKTGLAESFLPGTKIPSTFRIQLSDLLKSIGSPWITNTLERVSVMARIALLLYASKEPERLLEQLKLAQSDIKHIARLIQHCKKIRKSLSEGKLHTSAQFLKTSFEMEGLVDDFMDLYPLTGIFYHRRKFILLKDLTVCRSIRMSVFKLAGCRFNLTGDDLIRTFCIRGAEIGSMLSCARDYWFSHPQAGKEELLKFVQRKLVTKEKEER